jgi:hypothetical protein
MEHNKIREPVNNFPLCQFGPGGEFVSFLNDKDDNNKSVFDNPIAKVLSTLAGIIGAVITPQFACSEYFDHNAEKQPQNLNLLKKDSKSAIDKIYHLNNTTAVADIKINSSISDQPTLFSNDSGAGRRIGDKPHYRIRAYHRSARKKPCFNTAGQGSLFEADHRRARTA